MIALPQEIDIPSTFLQCSQLVSVMHQRQPSRLRLSSFVATGSSIKLRSGGAKSNESWSSPVFSSRGRTSLRVPEDDVIEDDATSAVDLATELTIG
jgi:hypothetical protein